MENKKISRKFALAMETATAVAKQNLHCNALRNKGKHISQGEMAEWSIAAVLKTVEVRASGGSNPSLSAKFNLNPLIFSGFCFLGEG